MVRFDGKHFTSFSNSEHGLGQYSFVRDLLEAPDGKLWGAAVGGVLGYAGGQFEWLTERNGLIHPYVYTIVRDKEHLWVGTGGTGVWSLEGGRFQPHSAYVRQAELPGKISDIIVAEDGSLWCATDRGILVLGAKPQVIGVAEGLPSNTVNVLVQGGPGVIWAGTALGLVAVSASTRSILPQEANFQGEHVTALLEDRSGALWVGTKSGLLLWREDGFETVSTTPVLALAEGENSIWWGTPFGVERLRDGLALTQGQAEGFSDEQILNVLPRRQGGLWALDASGALWTSDRSGIDRVLPSGSVAGAGMLGLAEGTDAGLVIAGQQLTMYREGGLVSIATAGEGAGFSVVSTDPTGLLVVRTSTQGESELFRLVGDQLVPLPVRAPLQHVQRLTRDSQGRLWISTGGTGLVRSSQQSERVFRTEDGLPSNTVYGVAEDGRGVIWVATRGGLARIDGERVAGYGKTPGGPVRSPVHIHLDGYDHLWATADDGIYRMAISDLDSVALDQESTLSPRIFTLRDGLRSTEISWRSSAQAVTPDGVIHYATALGIAEIDPVLAAANDDRPLRLVAVSHVRSAGKLVELTSQRAQLTNRHKTVEIGFTLAELLEPDEVEIRCRLAGFDTSWVPLDGSRSVYYGNLPSGRYLLEVAARRKGGDFGPSQQLLELEVLPLWFETPAAHVAGLVGFAALGYFGYALLLARQRRSQWVLSQRVAERTHELAPEVTERQAAERKALQLAGTLEQRVVERTAELELARLLSKRSEERYALAVRGAEDGLWDWDVAAGALYMSPRFKAILGYAEDEFASSFDAWLGLVLTDDQASFRAAMTEALGPKAQIRHEFRMLHRDGHVLWVLCRGVFSVHEERDTTRGAGSLTDLTKQKLAESEIERGATFDALTNLPNRRLFFDRVEQAQVLTRRGGRTFAVLFAGVDRLGSINGKYGHDAGDHALVTLGQRLRLTLRESDTVAHVGSDEFAMLLQDVADSESVLRVVAKLETVLAEPVQYKGESFTLGVNIGVRMRSDEGMSADDYLREARLAMNRAKNPGVPKRQLFDLALRAEVVTVTTDLNGTQFHRIRRGPGLSLQCWKLVQ